VIGIAIIVAINISRRLLRKHRIIKVLIIGVLLSIIFFCIYQYVEHKNELYYTGSKNYIYGRVKYLSPDKNYLKIDSFRTNFKLGGKSYIVVNVNYSTIIVNSDNDNDTLKFSDIKDGATIQVLCKEDKTTENNSTVNAEKIIIKIN
jgi:hypothetical protein